MLWHLSTILGRGLAVAAVAGSAGIAQAQLKPEIQTGSRIPVKPTVLDDGTTRKMVREFAACIAATHRPLATEHVLDRSNLETNPKYRPLLDGRCLQGSQFRDSVALRMAPETFRFALAEALLKDELATIRIEGLAHAAPLPLPRLDERLYQPQAGKTYTDEELKALEEHRHKDQSALILFKLGDCAARTDPKGARSVLLTEPDSAEESAAIQAVMPAVSNCLEDGLQLKMDRARLRGSLAFGFYSLAHAPRARR